MRVPFLDLRAAQEELSDELDAAYRRVVRSGRYVLGSEVERFEAAFADYCGTRHCVGVSNGLDALRLLLAALEIGPGDEVVVPGHTFIATWMAVSQVGAVPVPVEPDPATLNLSPDEVAAAVTARTRAIVAVHLYGQAANMEPLAAIARKHGVALIEDAAQAHGARYRVCRAGSLGRAAAWSFYPAKNLGALGDAGAVTTDDVELAARLRLLRNYGSQHKYHFDCIGFNARLDPLQAAFLAAKLPFLDEWNRRRRHIADRYLRDLDGCRGLRMPQVPAWAEPVWHLFVVRTPQRDQLADHLRAAGIETLIHYPQPPHLSEAYREAYGSAVALPLTEQASREVLSLPIGPHLGDDQLQTVIDAVCGWSSRTVGSTL